MRVVTSDEMREIDRKTSEEFGLSGEVLMERAGVSVAQKIKELSLPKKILVLSGPGNNGGDGIVAARELHNAGMNVRVILLFEKEKLSPDCLRELRKAERFKVPIEFRDSIDEKDTHGSTILDAIFGTGLKKPIKDPIGRVIDIVNNSHRPVVSVDIPSGISSDTGSIMGRAIRAGHTITFGLPKRGHLLHPGAAHTGVLHIVDIGFPSELISDEKITCRTIERDDIIVPERPLYSHKGDYGHVLLIAGSRGKTGAAFMAARACMRAGAGLITIGVPESLMGVFQERVTEEMTLPLPETKSGNISSKAIDIVRKFIEQKADVLAIGPGIGVSKEIHSFIEGIFDGIDIPSVIDADAISALKKPFIKRLRNAVITPHPGEISRLTGVRVEDIEKNRIGFAYEFIIGLPDNILVLKGAPTLVSGAGKVWINTTGNPSMAKAGSGDVLTGVISALLGQKLSPLMSAITGVYLHGLSGDISASEKGLHSVTATDIIEALPMAFKRVSH